MIETMRGGVDLVERLTQAGNATDKPGVFTVVTRHAGGRVGRV